MAFYYPSKVKDSNWIFLSLDEFSNKYPDKDGKWMMFFPMSQMDAKWAEACQLYKSGKLLGVRGMKASTAKQNPMPERLHGLDEGIIIFYCGPSENEANVLEYGRNILNNMYYPREKFFYKSDKPHLINNSNECKSIYTLNTFKHYTNELKRMKTNEELYDIDFYVRFYGQNNVNRII
jgi:hypothetical protein